MNKKEKIFTTILSVALLACNVIYASNAYMICKKHIDDKRR